MNNPLERTKTALNTLNHCARAHPDLYMSLPFAIAIDELLTAAQELVAHCERALDEGDWA